MRRFVFLVPLFALCACDVFDADDESWECDDSFHEVQFWVVDSTGEPRADFVITVTNQRTKEVYDVSQHAHTPGRYVAISDGFNDDVSIFGDPIRVHGEDGTRTFDADFEVVRGRCHIGKVSGPDSVVVAGP